MKRVVAAIDGIMVENTAVGLARQLSNRAGITRVDVNPEKHTVSIDFDELRVQVRDIDRYIAECGYHGLRGDWRAPDPRA